MLDSPRNDPSLLVHKRRRRAERLSDVYHNAGDFIRSERAQGEADEASDEYDYTHPTSWRGVKVKLRQAIVAFEDDTVERMLRHFFRTRRTFDGNWLRDFRYHMDTIRMMPLDNGNAISYLQSILAGMSKPRLV